MQGSVFAVLLSLVPLEVLFVPSAAKSTFSNGASEGPSVGFVVGADQGAAVSALSTDATWSTRNTMLTLAHVAFDKLCCIVGM